MASCRQIESMLQAKIDGELGHAEGVIFDQHLAECKVCARLLRHQQRTTAFLFEVLAKDRLSRDLRQGVMENLPEMEPLRIDVQGVNWREKTPKTRKNWWASLVPAVAALVLVCLAIPLYWAWPRFPAANIEAVGVITQSQGMAKTCMDYRGAQVPIALRSLIGCGYRFETGPNARLMLTLRGPSHIRVDENTRLRVCDDRELSIETGRVLLDVSKSERQFIVDTPSGKITVFGTLFDVVVNSEKTIVTLKSGLVQVENAVASAELHPGQQIVMMRNQKHLQPQEIDVASVMQWADTLVLDQEAYNLFARKIEQQSIAQLPAEEVFAVITTKDSVARPVSSFYVTWEPDSRTTGHCSYDVHVYNGSMVELFKDRIDGSVFADENRRNYEINVPGEPIRNVDVIHIKLVPDFGAGNIKTSFVKVWALGI